MYAPALTAKLATALAALTFVAAVPPAATEPPPLAAPRIIMFHGGELGDQRVYMVDWYENLALMLTMADQLQPVPDRADRAYVDIAMYWHGPTWEPWATDTAKLRTLTPEQGDRSRLWLGDSTAAAFVQLGPGNKQFRLLDPRGNAILRKHEVPVTQ